MTDVEKQADAIVHAVRQLMHHLCICAKEGLDCRNYESVFPTNMLKTHTLKSIVGGGY